MKRNNKKTAFTVPATVKSANGKYTFKVTAIANKMTVAQLLKGMRAHPTYNEGIGEALEEAEGGAIHVVPKKKK